jgi:hypothetical protein
VRLARACKRDALNVCWHAEYTCSVLLLMGY